MERELELTVAKLVGNGVRSLDTDFKRGCGHRYSEFSESWSQMSWGFSNIGENARVFEVAGKVFDGCRQRN